jgi:hypothetical protein
VISLYTGPLMWTLIGSAAAVTIALTFLLPGMHRHQMPAGDPAGDRVT